MGLITMGHPCRDLRESDANGFVQKAISAANVYNNIVKYVEDANITSLTTLNLSKSSEEVNAIQKKTQRRMCQSFITFSSSDSESVACHHHLF